MKKIFLIIMLVQAAYAQNPLYMPLNFQDAFEHNTRAANGMPGSNYWQNNSDYEIHASVEPRARTLTGNEAIAYHNNSPDTLDRIVIRLYQNINKLSSVHDFPIDDSEKSDGMVVTRLAINSENIDLADAKKVEIQGTNMIIRGIKIMPHSEVSISGDWHFVIPEKNAIRMGAYDSTSLFVAYWYPQVAVYDDIDGWDMVNYTGMVEFYNDFNRYDVYLTVPNNQFIWSTGILQNREDIFTPELMTRYKKAEGSFDVVNIINESDVRSGKVLLSNTSPVNMWHISITNIPDFTFGMSDHYLWDMCLARTGTGSVPVSAVYKADTNDYHDVCKDGAATVEYLSNVQPGVPFPYPGITIFDGEGGMESPMMVNESVSSQHIWQVYVTTHEISHTYFPFFMGINERKYAWMDEGWAEFLDQPIDWQLDTAIDFRARDVFRYTNLSGQDIELSPMAISYVTKNAPYGNASYFRPAAAYNTLKELLGDELFKKALQEYIRRWNGKHPIPYDFFNTFNDVAKEDLSWFWRPWFFESGYPDLGIDSVVLNEGIIRIHVVSEGNIPTSVNLTVKFTDGSSKTSFHDCSVFRFYDNVWIDLPTGGKRFDSVKLGSKYIPDVNNENDYWDE